MPPRKPKLVSASPIIDSGTRDLVIQVAQRLDDHIRDCGQKHEIHTKAIEMLTAAIKDNDKWIRSMLVLIITGLVVAVWQILIVKGVL